MSKYIRRPELLTLVTSYDDCSVDISKDEYLKITSGFMKFIADKIVDGDEVILPMGMGTIMVTGRKQDLKVDEDGNIRGLAPDWRRTIKLWKDNPEAKKEKKMVYFFNEHTRGIIYKFSWYTLNIPLRFKKVFAFYAIRKNKRQVSDNIINGKEYRQIKKRRQNVVNA